MKKALVAAVKLLEDEAKQLDEWANEAAKQSSGWTKRVSQLANRAIFLRKEAGKLKSKIK